MPAETRTELSEDIVMSGTLKLITGAAIAASLVATVAVARTLHTAATERVDPSSTVGAAPGDYALARRHGNIACGAIVETNCEALEMMLPQ